MENGWFHVEIDVGGESAQTKKRARKSIIQRSHAEGFPEKPVNIRGEYRVIGIAYIADKGAETLSDEETIGWVVRMLEALARAFGKGMGFGLGLFFLTGIFVPILGFGKARYQSPQV